MSCDCTPVGTIIPYKGFAEPEGWIFCDGKERNNNDNIFKLLIELEIGTFNSLQNIYIPPDHTGSTLTKVDDTYNDKVNMLLLINKQFLEKINKCHVYIKNNTIEKSYNNCYTNIISKNNENSNFGIVNNEIKWLIKYK